MKILVTGGAGFIGSHLVERLMRMGDEVTCLDDFNDFYDPAIKRRNISAFLKNKNFTLVEGDIRNEKLIEKIFFEHAPQAVVHLAARAGVRPSIHFPKLYAEVNILGTLNLLEAAKKFPPKKFIFASSSSVYGSASKLPFSEDDPASEPLSPYAATKRAGELLCYNYHRLYNFPIACLRFFTVYGPRQRPEMAIHSFIRSILRKETLRIFGDGNTSRDYTYIDDIIDGIISSLKSQMNFEIMNLGNSRPVALKDLLRTLEKYCGMEAKIAHEREHPGDMRITSADVLRAEKLIGFHPRVDFEEGIRRTVDWCKKEYSL